MASAFRRLTQQLAASGSTGGVAAATTKIPKSMNSIIINKKVPLFINNEFVDSATDVNLPGNGFPINDPSTQDLIAITPQASNEELLAATSAAAQAFTSWSQKPLVVRQRFIAKFLNIVRDRTDELAEILTLEQGKTLEDAKGDIIRGLEAVENALTGSACLLGESLPNISTNVDTITTRQPLGVCAGIAPFNFPAMIPLWMFPTACVSGNTYVLKPSERVPLTTMKMMEWLKETDIPPGVVNIVHGGVPTVQFICSNPSIQAISFVGGNKAGEYIYAEGAKNGKRVQANMGAKNHAVILPDADKEDALDMLCNAAFGAAGQRCMAISVGVMVGETKNWIPDITKRAAKYKVGPGLQPGMDVGPLISPAAKKRAINLVEESEKQGAKIEVNGLNIQIPNYPYGNFVGPTVVNNVKPTMPCYTEEVFGPVLSLVQVDTLEEAIALINSSSKGNGTAVFTTSGAAARKFQHEIEVGQVGINLPIPVPVSMFSFTGWKGSFRGENYLMGKMGFNFFTKTKTIISRWKYEPKSEGISGSFPIFK